MSNLFFPQLASGALAQYPTRRTRTGRTVKNVLPDGTLISYPDPDASRVVWDLGYAGLSAQDVGALTAHFNACQGRFHAFTFIDPTGNMLVNSANLTGAGWSYSNLIQITANYADPNGGLTAFTVTNTANVSLELAQTLIVPAGYRYCFSMYALSAQATTLTLARSGAASQQTNALQVGTQWSRIVSSGRLTDQGTSFTVAVSLSPGQQVFLYGLQLEAQMAPSRYKATAQFGGVYANAHWGSDEMAVSADAPDLFSTVFSIEASI